VGVAGSAAGEKQPVGLTIRLTAAKCARSEPIKEAGMQDYRLDEIEDPQRHPAALERLTGQRRGSPIDFSSGELPGRKVDGRR